LNMDCILDDNSSDRNASKESLLEN
jgi:hypothetical protein